MGLPTSLESNDNLARWEISMSNPVILNRNGEQECEYLFFKLFYKSMLFLPQAHDFILNLCKNYEPIKATLNKQIKQETQLVI